MPPTDPATLPASRVTVTTTLPESRNEDEKRIEKLFPRQELSSTSLFLVRMIYVISIVTCYVKSDYIQENIDSLWSYIKNEWWFQTVYFETLLVIVYSFPATLIYRILDRISYFNKYKIAPSGGHFISEPNIVHFWHSVEYFLPLGFLDTFHVKHYSGVTDDVIQGKRGAWIQTTRALPEDAPLLGDMIQHIFIAIIFYDILFFVIHYNLHRNQTLYRIFHKTHHTHDHINAKVTDQNHWVERVALILSANAGLKMQGAHPLTRMMFVFVFVGLLLYNHGGYDFPFMPDRILPEGVMCGARQHFKHHAKGDRNYQFIFTYLDKTLEWWTRRQKKVKGC